jgi:hypothetical protein
MESTPTGAPQGPEPERVRKLYTAPHLIRHGTVEALTGVPVKGSSMIDINSPPPR